MLSNLPFIKHWGFQRQKYVSKFVYQVFSSNEIIIHVYLCFFMKTHMTSNISHKLFSIKDNSVKRFSWKNVTIYIFTWFTGRVNKHTEFILQLHDCDHGPADWQVVKQRGQIQRKKWTCALVLFRDDEMVE